MKEALARLACDGTVPVFPLIGEAPPGRVDRLWLNEHLTCVGTPRAATILLVAGHVPPSLYESARRVHDQMPNPRCTVWWPAGDFSARRASERSPFGPGTESLQAVVFGGVDADPRESCDEVARMLRTVHDDLVDGKRRSEPDMLPNVEPAPWRGVGPYGQGGTGMTGGVPYGRPMAGRAPDRDRLELDQLPLRVGPYFSPFPAGLVLDVKLQGDVIQELELGAVPRSPVDRIFATALVEPVSIAALEVARAQSHLRWLAHALRVHGLTALGKRALRLAFTFGEDESSPMTFAAARSELRAIRRAVDHSGLFWWSTRGVGALSEEMLRGDDDAQPVMDVSERSRGAVGRAAGMREDLRMGEPAYRALGFEPVVQVTHGRERMADASARWRQRIEETFQSLDLAERAGDALAWGAGSVEGPRGAMSSDITPETALYAMLPHLLPGMAWEDAVTTVVSLDLGVGGAVDSVRPWAAKNQAEASAQSGASGGHAMSGSHSMSGMAGM